MKYFGNKGQGAMEYLMTYGWAILVVMVVGIVMWQMGIFNIGGGTASTASGFARLKPLLATGVLLSSADPDTLTMTFTNGAGGTISSFTTVTADCGNGAVDCSTVTSPSSGIKNGDTFTISACSLTGTNIAQGDPYVCDVVLTYVVNVAGQTVTRTDTGTLRGPAD